MKGENIFLSAKESRRVYVMEQVVTGKMTVKQAAINLELSERQIKRLKKGMNEQGVSCLAHKNRGRKPKHAIPQDVKERVISLANEKLKDASCEHMAELLHSLFGITLSARSIRRILSQAGVRNPHSKKVTRKRRSRTRMPQEGLLVQCDASPYAWLEERGPVLSLHGIIDDATGKILGLYFRTNEDLHGYFQVLKQMVLNHGVPISLYSDRHTIFFSPNKDKLSIEDELAGKRVSLTQFGKALEELGINHIAARSPQAKGRIERLWGTLQSRLVVEMRLEGICSLEEANAFLLEFIRRFNSSFTVPAKDPDLAFKPAPPATLLNNIFAFRECRKASNGSTISLKGKSYQLVNDRGIVVALAPRSSVTVLTHLDGSTIALHQDKLYLLREFVQLEVPHRNTKKPGDNPKSPAADHPWRRPHLPAMSLKEPIEAYLQRKRYRLRVFA